MVPVGCVMAPVGTLYIIWYAVTIIYIEAIRYKRIK
nr:MAG TPA: hypothetical protein [Caudoviricetes sp.]DAP63375.1 MAG TPA: hypothetical protein [Caudoviricetes sp.]